MTPPGSWPGDFPDPFVLRSEGGYTAYGTNVAGRHLPLLSSADLGEWADAGNGLPRLPRWASVGFTWSPSVLARPGYVVLYVTVREPRSGRQAIAVAASPSPRGPFEPDDSGPLMFQVDLGGSIDPSPFVDADGQAYLLWKADANARHRPASLWAQRLADDGLSLTGPATQLLKVALPGWEDPLIEAPCMVRHGGRYYLFYSGGRWASASYGVGYATAPHPLGPWTRVSERAAWFCAGSDVSGPGGQELFEDATGQWWMAYHGWDPARVTYRARGVRSLRMARVTFVDGCPVVDR
jgi:beta-xylosidase